MAEIWKVVVAAPAYEVSSIGRVRRVKPGYGTRVGRVLKPKINKQGYHVYTLYVEKKSRCFFIQRLVCEAFNGGRPSDEHFALHRDDNRDNNEFENLYWGTRLENADDALRNDKYCRGETHGFSKMTDDNVRLLRMERQEFGTKYSILGAKFGLSKGQVGKIINRQLWDHVA